MSDFQTVIDESLALRALVRERQADSDVAAAINLLERLRNQGRSCVSPDFRARLEAEARHWGLWIHDHTDEFLPASLHKYAGGPKPPYKFLSSFEESDSDIFFGRSSEVEAGVTAILQAPLTVVYGPVGSGKTSLLRAGIAPALRATDCTVVSIRAGGEPRTTALYFLSNLLVPDASTQVLAEDDLLARLNAKEGPLVLIVDQLEEAFVVGSLESQDAFFSFVRRFLEYGTAIHRSDNPGRRRVVLAMRDDFVHRLLRQQHLFPELLRNTLLVAALNIDQARSAIAEPALHAGLRYDPELLNELIKALSHDGVVRPSELQIVCDALYNHRTEGASTIDFDTYRRAGDVSTILGTYLDRVLESLGKSQEAGKKLLAAMVSPELTSVPLSMSRAMNIVLYSGLQETALEGLLGTLENARLIKRTSHADPEWELAHEFLIDRIQRDFDDRDVQIMNLRANLRQGQSTWVGGYPLEVLDQATRLHDEAGLNPGDSARLLASAVTHGSHLEHWIKANVSNERVDEVVAPLLHHEDTEIVRRAAVALSFVSHADESRESVLNRLRSSGNPKVIAALRDLESRLGALSKNYWDKLKLAISLRLRHDLVEIPAATFEVGTSRNDILAILNRQNIPFSEVFFEGQYPAKSAECGRFWIDKFLVTNADFKEFDSFHTFPKGNELHPVTDVKWQDAERYAAWLGKRLATSAEWERAGRGPDGFAFPWGNEWRYDACNTRVSGFGGTTEVTAFPQGVSPFGCYDMAGNVWEWTADRATARSWELLPPDKSQPERRVLKGGSWTQMGILPWLWHRFDYPESEGYQNVGFRCVTDRPDPFDEVLND